MLTPSRLWNNLFVRKRPLSHQRLPQALVGKGSLFQQLGDSIWGGPHQAAMECHVDSRGVEEGQVHLGQIPLGRESRAPCRPPTNHASLQPRPDKKARSPTRQPPADVGRPQQRLSLGSRRIAPSLTASPRGCDPRPWVHVGFPGPPPNGGGPPESPNHRRKSAGSLPRTIRPVPAAAAEQVPDRPLSAAGNVGHLLEAQQGWDLARSHRGS